MCGIQAFIYKKFFKPSERYFTINDKLCEANSRRGPDHRGNFSTEIEAKNGTVYAFEFNAFVLSLRGIPTAQPLIGENSGDIFLWNGEVFGGLQIDQDQNDGLELFYALQSSSERENGVIEVFKNIRGPYSFIYLQKNKKKLWFARDCLGRRSLLKHFDSTSDSLLISSTCFENNKAEFWEEVAAPYIYCVDFNKLESGQTLESHVSYEWLYKTLDESCSELILPYRKLETELDGAESLANQNISTISNYKITNETRILIDVLRSKLLGSIRTRVESSLKAGFAVLFSGGLDCMVLAGLMDEVVPKDYPIDLINVAFSNPRILKASIKGRKKENMGHASENEYNVPDRKTGLVGVKELRECYPARTWNWVEVNVPYDEVLKHRQHIIDLLGPNYTVMDLSIGMALWFAARGEGAMYSSGSSKEEANYRSPAKVLILGMGADEQFGGYSRHRKAYEAGGIQQLSKEIKFDVERIAKRNLGRDDRIVAGHSREARFPYLDETVVDFVSAISTSRKMNMELPKGVGDKLLLRLLAHTMGLVTASMQAKRAIQFGARTAKMESSKDKGDDSLL